jgi:hypothetical protein
MKFIWSSSYGLNFVTPYEIDGWNCLLETDRMQLLITDWMLMGALGLDQVFMRGLLLLDRMSL